MPKGTVKNLEIFKNGHKKVGGRQKGTPNKCTPESFYDEFAITLNRAHTYYDEDGKTHKKKWKSLIVESLFNRMIEKGDPKAVELLLRVLGLLDNNVNLSGEVQLNTDISADRIFEELGKLADTVRDRESSGSNDPA